MVGPLDYTDIDYPLFPIRVKVFLTNLNFQTVSRTIIILTYFESFLLTL